VKEPWSGEFVRSLDVVVEIDPGIRNAGSCGSGFDRDNVAYVFDESSCCRTRTPADYAEAIREENKRWGLKRVLVRGGPCGEARGQTNAETVQQALLQHKIRRSGPERCAGGDRPVADPDGARPVLGEPECRGLRDEADDYAAKEPAEGAGRFAS
jgi:hypothetical protein